MTRLTSLASPRCLSPRLIALLAIGLALAPSLARAQLAGVSNSTTGSTCSGGSDTDGDCRNSVGFSVSNNGTTFTSRYAWNINADTGVGGTRDESSNAQHNISFTATAPGGYRLDIATSRSGDVNVNSDLVGCDGSANTGGVTGSVVAGPGLSSGTLNGGDPADQSGSGEIAFGPLSTSAVILGTSNGSAISHTLKFTWSGSVRSNSCEAAVRQGESSGATAGCSACGYAGSPSRTQSTDGHFVQVTLTSLCGNGTVDAGEQCDLGGSNGGATSCCTSTCQFRGAGQTCRASTGVCDPAETCSGSGATCPADVLSPSTTVCRSAAGECDIAENCTGTSGPCPTDAKKGSGTSCTSDGNPCTLDQCDGTNNTCQHPAGNAGTTCRASGGECDLVETCDGSSTTCPADVKKGSGTSCTDDGNPCSLDQCDGSSNACQHPAGNAGATCRASNGPCDPAESCTGASTSCPADSISAAPVNRATGAAASQSSTNGGAPGLAIDGNTDGTFANGSVSRTNTETEAHWDLNLGSVQSVSSIEVWNTSDGTEGNLSNFYVFVSDNPFTGTTVADSKGQAGVTAIHVPGQAQRPSTIDVTRTAQYIRIQLTGNNPLTLAEVRLLSGTVCRGAAGVCDVPDLCDGSGAACPTADLKQATECRASAGACDVAESCDGVSNTCPADGFQPSSVECRASAGVCDVAEHCSGSSAACPADGFAAPTVECRPSIDFCDVAETCPGNGPNCPPDLFTPAGTECRPQTGACDQAEACTGSSPTCPADGVKGAGTTCRGSAGTCDVAEVCDGSSKSCPADTFQPSGTVCRAAAGVCDVQEVCTGASAACPANLFVPAGTTCRAATDVCDVAETCTGSNANCPADGVAPSSTVCRGQANTCDIAETCDGSSKACPADLQSPDTDGDGVCDLVDNCDGTPNVSQADSDGDGIGDACDPCTNVAGARNATKKKIGLQKVLLPTGDDKLGFNGVVTIPTTPAVNPLLHGVRIIVEDAAGTVLDSTIPSGAYNPVARVGWRVNSLGTSYSYKNANATPANPIYVVKLTTSTKTPGVYKFTVRGKKGAFAVTPPQMPLKATLVIDQPAAASGQCAELSFPAPTNCRFNGTFSSVSCR